MTDPRSVRAAGQLTGGLTVLLLEHVFGIGPLAVLTYVLVTFVLSAVYAGWQDARREP